MIKVLALACIALICLAITVRAQRSDRLHKTNASAFIQVFKVSSVDASDRTGLLEATESLGREIRMTLTDNALRLDIAEENKPYVFRKLSDTTYYLTDNYLTYRLSLAKVPGMNSFILVKYNRKGNESAWQSLTARKL
ncbi:hypothetical protein HHL17_11585 [Chitinophaga sp. G-6-1-13]|uniref:DUF4783 domain-containing protein n=1 Tax=Chitinophaga fulva TaxID=2728842 RepID=A0A848GIZ5_9BACT|nr:hypothetical protein [Chitinophaga fulva]NML37837.1 hypothetical protein [Chitinophaga fulva]